MFPMFFKVADIWICLKYGRIKKQLLLNFSCKNLQENVIKFCLNIRKYMLKIIYEKIRKVFEIIKEKVKWSPLYWRTLIMFFAVVFLIKILVVYFSYKNLDSLRGCVSYIASDILILFFVQFLVTINSRIKRRNLRLFNDLIVSVVLIVYSIDIFTIFFFQSRVSIMDAMALWSNWSLWFASAVKLWVWIFVVIGIVTFFLSQRIYHKDRNYWKIFTLFFSICSVVYASFYFWIVYNKVDIDYIENVMSLNLNQLLKEKWYDDEDEKGTLMYDDYMFNIKWEWKDLNVILVFAESLSAIDSANVWWFDRIPWFDKIQNKGITYTNFITNWTTSDTAHISTLYGVIPLINMWANNTPYNWYKLLMEPLPQYLNWQWYHTTFVSAASLDFLDQRAFLSWAGFETIIWEEAFTGSKLYAFESAPDGDLYDRVLEEVKAQTGKYFIWLQTISFHRPYSTPNGKSESLALQYSDEELYRFYQGLQEIWFFDDWILIIIWDHRKMNPAEEWERELFWSNRYTRSVATVVWSWIQPWTINSSIIQHTDFYNSLKVLLWDWFVKIDKTYNDAFSDKVHRGWWITNAEFYEINRYTVSYNDDNEPFLFRNLSNLRWKNDEIYNYFSSYLSFEFWSSKEYGWMEEDNQIRLIWHRWSINDYPENTLQSFLSAKEKWASWIEFDVSYTKDRQNIVVHWEELYASNCTKLKVWDYNLDRITKNCTIINWEKYKTLKEMLETIDGLFDYYFLEIKVYDEKLWAEQTLKAIQTVRELNMLDRVIFISYSDAAREVLNSDPDVIFWRDTFNVDDLDFIWENNSKYFLAPYDMLTQEIVDRVRWMWKDIVTYTVNTTWDYQTMKDLWVNTIMTDDINLLYEYDSVDDEYDGADI